MAVTTTINTGVAHASYDNVKDTFPLSQAPTSGTISVTSNLNTVEGTTTVFKTDFNAGDHIWFTSTDEIRKIASIESDTMLTLELAVAGAITTQAFKKVKPVGYSNISWANDATGVSNINGIAMPASLSGSYDTSKERVVLLIDSTVGGGIVNVIAK